MEGGRAVSAYFLVAPQPADLQSAIIQILGTTQFAATATGKLARTPPLAHPLYPWLYASSILDIKGVGTYTLTNAEPTLEVPPLPQFALYAQYKFTIEFKPRPYPIVTDDTIQEISTGSWYPETGAGTSIQNFSYAAEWARFVDFTVTPLDDYVTQQVGQMRFVTGGTGTPNANTATYTGSPRLFIPNQVIKFIWYGVPYRYMSSPNSYITRWTGRINQNAWGTTYPSGSLLYHSFKPTLYTPPVQKEVTDMYSGQSVFSTEKLMNLELEFIWTTRTTSDPPTGPTSGNLNYVIYGHNALPWHADRLFHYAESAVAPNPPSFLSFPIEVLFSDPDTPGAI
jgi:hypothetical protein